MTEPEDISKQVSIRLGRPSDDPFIFSSWLKSYFVGSDFCKDMTKTTFYAYHHKIVERILRRSQALIVTPIGEDDLILAYMVSEVATATNPILHYLYVKEAFRGDGMASLLIKTAGIPQKATITHVTNAKNIDYLRNKHEFNYCPYLM